MFTTYVSKILLELNIPTNSIFNPGGYKQKITYEDLVLKILLEDSIENVAKSFNFSKRYFFNLLQKSKLNNFILCGKLDTPTGSRTWKTVLLRSIKYKQCCSCKEILDYTEFYYCKSNFDSLQTRCKKCSVYSATERQEYIEKATPNWVNRNEIINFYKNCPKTHHVDHIVPLRGNNVCGLHIINNLQYLPIKENLSKGNKYT